jgi:peroxiredoxin/Tfp pilus assembly protein PilF
METVVFARGRSGARRPRLLAVVVGVGLLVLLQPAEGPWTTVPVASARQDDSAFDIEMDKGREFLRRRQYEEALKSFKRASEMRGKKSPECFLAMANAYQGLEAYKNVAENCDKVIELAPNDSILRVQAYNLKGLALHAQAETRDHKKLKEAEAEFRQGLALNVGLRILHYNLGIALLQQGRDQEGVAELKKYVELQSEGEYAGEARKLIENPRRAREAYAPEFSITTSDGEYLSLEDLRGKVVLLDFWGTWCPPCVASVPSLRSLRKRFAKEPAFVMIGISSDSEREKWREFIAKNQMAWPQYLDRDRRVQKAFAVRAFPTYILIDHEGIIRFRSIGAGREKDADLEEVIRKQVKILAKAAGAG